MFGKKRKFKNVDVEIFPGDAREEPQETVSDQLNREYERRLREAEEEISRVKKERERALRAFRDWRPDVSVRDYASGKFLCYDGMEFPIAHITGIEVNGVGGEPALIEGIRGDEWGSPFYPRAIINKASLVIELSSGRTHCVECWDFQIEVLKERLEQAWKEGK